MPLKLLGLWAAPQQRLYEADVGPCVPDAGNLAPKGMCHHVLLSSILMSPVFFHRSVLLGMAAPGQNPLFTGDQGPDSSQDLRPQFCQGPGGRFV